MLETRRRGSRCRRRRRNYEEQEKQETFLRCIRNYGTSTEKVFVLGPNPDHKRGFFSLSSLGGPEERKPILKNGSLLDRTIRREAFVFF